jgi:uncharacterized protein (TIGR03790 family)
VLVVVNERSEESLEIGQRYLRARGIPDANVCRLGTSTAFTVSKATYQAEIETPIGDCIASGPLGDRIDYLVLTRGLPIRANFPDASSPPTSPVSVTELLRVMDTTLWNKDQEYGPPYGFLLHGNPYRGQRESHEHSKLFGGHRLRIATMLSGYWSEHANALIERSLASDGSPPDLTPGAAYYLEESTDPASPANTRNAGIPAAVATLQAMGVDAVHVRGSDPDVASSVVASHLNAGSYSSISRAEIRSNTYPPGALVCALESFGLVPNNFDPDASPSQVPVTWWIEAGATGGHGTVAEPYNVAFPDADLFEPWVEGYNLGETYYQGIPYLYWMNLVLGDPLAAPHAVPPSVTIAAPAPGAVVSGTVRFEASATTPKVQGIRQLEFFAGDSLVHVEPDGAGWLRLDTAAFPDGPLALEVVAFENTPIDTQGSGRIEVLVDNSGLQLAIASPLAGAVVSGVVDVVVDGSPSLTGVELNAFGALLGQATGPPPWTLPVDTARLGRGLVTLRARAEDGTSAVRSAGVDVQVAKPPRVHALTPPEGPDGGGTTVLVTGWNFEPDARVFFAGAEASALTRLDANRLEVVTPPGPVGPADVLIESLGLATTAPGGFTYLGACPADDDGDGACDDVDNCLGLANPDQADADADDCGDACDPAPGDPTVDCSTPDSDGDGVVDPLDNCPAVPNADQADADGDGVGDACSGCAVTAPVTGLLVARDPDGRLRLSWTGSTDPCLASYAVLAATDPPDPPTLPADYADVTDRDEDGNAGGDATFLGSPDAGTLSLLQVVGRGTDGELGP